MKIQEEIEKTLDQIKQTLEHSAGEGRNDRIYALEQLLRSPLGDKDWAIDLFCQIVQKLGPIEPELTLLSKLLARVLRANGHPLDKLISLIKQHHAGAIRSAIKVLHLLGSKPQASLAEALTKELLLRETNDPLMETLVATLRDVKNAAARKAVTKELSGCLSSPDGLEIRNAVAILSAVADKSVEPELVEILNKLLNGYYGGHKDPLRKDLCSYFVKFKSRLAVPGLLRGIEKQWDHGLFGTIGAICDSHREIQTDVVRFAERTKDMNVRFGCVACLAAMQKTKPRIGDIVKLIRASDLRFDWIRANFRRLFLRNPKESKRIVLEMLRNPDERWHDFALEALKEMGVPMAEVTKATGVNPIVAIYEYFFERRSDGLGLKALWEAKQKLGDGVKGKTTKFEHLLRHLLSCLGFITLDVDASQKAGVDTVAFPPIWSHALLIGGTTGVVGDNLEKLSNTVREVKTALGELSRKIAILPVVATSISGETNPRDEEYARKHRIVVLRQSDIDLLVDWVNTNRSYKKFLTHVEVKAGKGRRPSLLEVLERSTGSKKGLT